MGKIFIFSSLGSKSGLKMKAKIFFSREMAKICLSLEGKILPHRTISEKFHDHFSREGPIGWSVFFGSFFGDFFDLFLGENFTKRWVPNPIGFA